MTDTNYKNVLAQLETTLDEYLIKQAPQLPPNVKEIIVKIAPYLTILSIIITIPALIAVVTLGGIATSLSPVGGADAVRSLPGMWISTLLLIPVLVLEILAVKGLFARTIKAWRYMYWAQLITVVTNIITFNIVGLILNVILGLYILFQVKSYYK